MSSYNAHIKCFTLIASICADSARKLEWTPSGYATNCNYRCSQIWMCEWVCVIWVKL